jgi:hypothetical protein
MKTKHTMPNIMKTSVGSSLIHFHSLDQGRSPRFAGSLLPATRRGIVGLAAMAATLALAGCASMIRSTDGSKSVAANGEGIYYYLPKGVIKVMGVWDSTTGIWDLTATPVFVPDRDAGVHFLEENRLFSFDDNVTLAADPTTGLLQTVTGGTTDQTVNSIASLGSAFSTLSPASFASLAAPAAAAAAATPAPAPLDQLDIAMQRAQFSTFQTYLDPEKFKDPDGNIALGAHTEVFVASTMSNSEVTYARYDLYLRPLNRSAAKVVSNAPNEGVIVRDPVPYTLEVTGNLWFTQWKANGDPGTTDLVGTPPSPLQYAWTYNIKELASHFTLKFPTTREGRLPVRYHAFSQIVALTDADHTRTINISRRPFVQDSTSLTLVNGVVQNLQWTRPSMLAGITGIPKTILTSIVPIPGTGSSTGTAASQTSSAGSTTGSSQGASPSSGTPTATGTPTNYSPIQ